MSRKAIVTMVAAAVLAAVTGAWLLRDRATASSRVDPSAPSATPMESAEPVAATPLRARADQASRAPSRAPSAELPRFANAPDPAVTKPVELIRFWRQQAMTGDPEANCRFASLAAGCAMRRAAYSPWARHRIPNLRDHNGELMGEDCDGITDGDVQGRFEALLGAAQRGHAPAAVLFASGIGSSSFIPIPDEVRRFRSHAPQLAWRAFASGDSDAAVLLWRAYNRVGAETMPLAAAIDPDPVKAHALDLLMGDLVPGFVVGTAAEAGLSKAQAAQAEAMRAEWRATAFAQGKPPRYGLEIERLFDWDKRAVDLCAPDPR